MRLSHFQAKALNRLHCLSLLNGTVAIRINQKKFIIPLLGRQGFDNLDLSEPWMTQTLLSLRGLFNGHFVDVGVNIGQTLLKALAVFDKPQYIGFEPNPSCVNYLQELVRVNALNNTVILPIAVGAETEMLKLNFFSADQNDSSASVIENFRPNNRTDHYIYVPVFDFHLLTRFLPSRPFSILKIEVEGAELEVLMGLKEWIQEWKPLILLEILPVYSTENQSRLDRQNNIEGLLLAWNYKIGRIKKEEPVSLQIIDTIGIHSSMENCDYLLYPASIHEKITGCFPAAGKS